MAKKMFDVTGKVIVVTGGYGVLGGSIARHLASQGARVVVVGRSEEKGAAFASEIGADFERADVLDRDALVVCREAILQRFERIDGLINVAGGNVPGATLAPDQPFFEMQPESWSKVVDLNLDGTVLPSMVFGEAMARQRSGSIVNISSMAALSAITRVPGYGAAKAAVSNFTQWLAVEMASKYGDGVRVNAIAPGFFIGDQNRAILINPDGSLTDRSRKVLAKTPMGRFGDIAELNGAVQFLCSRAASFVTGAVIAVDGGFSAFSGV